MYISLVTFKNAGNQMPDVGVQISLLLLLLLLVSSSLAAASLSISSFASINSLVSFTSEICHAFLFASGCHFPVSCLSILGSFFSTCQVGRGVRFVAELSRPLLSDQVAADFQSVAPSVYDGRCLASKISGWRRQSRQRELDVYDRVASSRATDL